MTQTRRPFILMIVADQMTPFKLEACGGWALQPGT
jgi:hypothetical protein